MKQKIDSFDPSLVPNYVDWRLPENRLEAVTRIANWRYLTGDMDHTHLGRTIQAEMKLTPDQSAWFCLLFGQSYRFLHAAMFMQMWPDMENVNPDEIQAWMDAHYVDAHGNHVIHDRKTGALAKNGHYMVISKDSKWSRWKIADQIRSIQENIPEGLTLNQHLNALCTVGDNEANRKSLDTWLHTIRGFGWMSTWLSGQGIYDLFGYDIDVYRLPIPDNWSSYNGLCYFMSEDHRTLRKDKEGVPGYRPTQEDVQHMHGRFIDLMEHLNRELPFTIDAYSVESILCEGRKLFVGNARGVATEYTSWTTLEYNEILHNAMSDWGHKLDFTPALIAQMTKSEVVTACLAEKEYFKITKDTGLLQAIDQCYDDMPDVFQVLDIPHPTEKPDTVLIKEWNHLFTVPEQHELEMKYNPLKKLKWKSEADQAVQSEVEYRPYWRD